MDCLGHQRLNQSWRSIHHASDRWPEALLCFCTCAMLMNSNDCAIQEKLFQINIIGDLFQKTFPNLFFDPTGVPRVHTVPVAKAGSRSRQGDPVRAIHSTASINNRLPGRSGQGHPSGLAEGCPWSFGNSFLFRWSFLQWP